MGAIAGASDAGKEDEFLGLEGRDGQARDFQPTGPADLVAQQADLLSERAVAETHGHRGQIPRKGVAGNLLSERVLQTEKGFVPVLRIPPVRVVYTRSGVDRRETSESE